MYIVILNYAWIMLCFICYIYTLSLGNVVLIFMIQMIYILWISWCINCTRCTCELDIFFLNFNFVYKSLQYQKLFAYNFTSSLAECFAPLQILNQFKQSISEKIHYYYCDLEDTLKDLTDATTLLKDYFAYMKLLLS